MTSGPWQPITTAKKNGRVVLGFAKSLINEDFNPEGTAQIHWQDDMGWRGNVWCDCHDTYHTQVINDVSHWMPLPGHPVDGDSHVD